jgi:hypothetical protein
MVCSITCFQRVASENDPVFLKGTYIATLHCSTCKRSIQLLSNDGSASLLNPQDHEIAIWKGLLGPGGMKEINPKERTSAKLRHARHEVRMPGATTRADYRPPCMQLTPSA